VKPVHLEVFGVPAPQGNKSAFIRGGRAVVVEGKGPGRQSHAAWRQAVATAARDWQEANRQGLIDEPVFVSMHFRLPRPKSTPKKVVYQAKKPDLDKLVRSVLDAVSGVVLADDARVVKLLASKDFATDTVPPGASIGIYEMPQFTLLSRPLRVEDFLPTETETITGVVLGA